MKASSHTTASTDPRSERAAQEALEREKTAMENISQGYGHPKKAGHISAEPDGDTQGGPGANNPDGVRPPKTGH